MSRQPSQQPSLHDFARGIARRPLWVVVPAVVAALVAVAYGVATPHRWEAVQTLSVREEASGSDERPGKFKHVDEMKAVQETVLELSKSQDVLAAALREVGPESGDATNEWPSRQDVEQLAGSIKLAPPKGAEFGTTEMFYLVVEGSSPARAADLARAVANQLAKQNQELRNDRAQSVIDELTHTESLARVNLDQATAAVARIERAAGRDLSELRILQESPSGDSQLRRTVTELEHELRQMEASQQLNRELLVLLEDAQADATSLLAAPNRLLEVQPALRQLKEGLVAAQLRTAQLQGNMSDEHPLVRSSKLAEVEVARNLRAEVQTAISGVGLDQRVTDGRIATLKRQLAEAGERMTRLAATRAEYANVVADARHRTELLRMAEQQLAEARASEAAARTVSLLQTVGQPQSGMYPVGPGSATVGMLGLLGGAALGLGLVFLTLPPATQPVKQPLEAGRISVSEVTPVATAPTAEDLTFKAALRKLARQQVAWR